MKKWFKSGLFLVILIFIIFLFPMELLGENWLHVDISGEEQVWIDSSYWKNERVWVTDGYFKETLKKEWVNDKYYTVNQGYWKTEEYRIWINSSTQVPYVAYRWVDTSHWERSYRYTEKWISVNLTIYVGTSKYGWGVYSFASKPKGTTTIIYNGERYKAYKDIIDYRPSYGGHIHATRYRCYGKEVRVKEYYNAWVSSGYQQAYTAYRTEDTSHWETGTRKVWVDTSYTVPSSGYWHSYTEKEWVDTSHYEYRSVLVKAGFYTSPIHGEIIVRKNPKYIFTKWHKDKNGEECYMELDIDWKVDNSELLEEEVKEIVRVYIYQDVHRFNGKGVEKVIIFDEDIPPSAEGDINTVTRFDYSGSEDSILHIYLYTQNGESAHIYFSNPINGFRSINLDSEGSNSDANTWIGGNNYGKIEF